MNTIDPQFYSQQYRDQYDPSLFSDQLETWRTTPDASRQESTEDVLVLSTLDSNNWDHPDAFLNTIKIISAEIDKYAGKHDIDELVVGQLDRLRNRLNDCWRYAKDPEIRKTLNDTIKKIDHYYPRPLNHRLLRQCATARNKTTLVNAPRHRYGVFQPQLDGNNPDILFTTVRKIAQEINPPFHVNVTPSDFSRLHRLRATLVGIRRDCPEEVRETLEEAIANTGRIIQCQIKKCTSDDFDDAIRKLDGLFYSSADVRRILQILKTHEFYLSKTHLSQLKQLAENPPFLLNPVRQIADLKGLMTEWVADHLSNDIAKLTIEYCGATEPITFDDVQNGLPPVLADIVMQYHNPEIEIVTALLNNTLQQQHLDQLLASPLLCSRFVKILFESIDEDEVFFLMAQFIDLVPVPVQNCVFEAANRLGSSPSYDINALQHARLLKRIPPCVTRLGLGQNVSKLFIEAIFEHLANDWRWLEEVHIPATADGLSDRMYRALETHPLRVLSIPANFYILPRENPTALSQHLQELTIRGAVVNNEMIQHAITKIVKTCRELRVLKIEYPEADANPQQGRPRLYSVEDIREMIAAVRPNGDSDLEIVVVHRSQ